MSVPVRVAAYATTSGTTSTATTSPAPDGEASASAVQVGGDLLVIGQTSAKAGQKGGSSSANSLTLLGTQISGGTDHSNPQPSELIGTGATPLGHAEVAPWSAHASHTSNSSTAAAEAALAHVDLADVFEVWLLHSRSHAAWSQDSSGNSQSTGDSTSDGAEVSALGQLDIKVLHSDAHSGKTGKSDLLVVNDSEIGSSDQVDGQCEIPADPLIHLLCLTADGGTSSTGVTTSDGTVISVDIGGGQLPGTVSSSSTKGGKAQTPAGTPAHHNGGKTSGGKTTNGSRVPNAPGPDAALPFTGSDAGRLAALGLAFAALGSAMVAFGRRTRRMLAVWPRTPDDRQ